MSQLERCRVWLEPALAEARAIQPWSYVCERVADNAAQLWPGKACALLTSLVMTDEGPCCHIWLGGGDLDEIIAMHAGLAAWARAQGADHATLHGRRGWHRLLKRHGWREAGSELRLDL